MTIVHLGNPCPKNSFAQPGDTGTPCECCDRTDVRHEPVEGPEVTTWSVQNADPDDPAHYSLLDCVKSICERDGAWANHTFERNAAPLWVESDDPALEAVLADHFKCGRGRPDDFVTASQKRSQDTVAVEAASSGDEV